MSERLATKKRTHRRISPFRFDHGEEVCLHYRGNISQRWRILMRKHGVSGNVYQVRSLNTGATCNVLELGIVRSASHELVRTWAAERHAAAS